MMLKEAIIRNYIRRILNESNEKEKTKMVDLTLGDYTDSIPVSLVDKIKKIIRELIELESSSDDLVSNIVNGSNVDERKKNVLSALLTAISNKFGKGALTKISQDFPFFTAEGKESYTVPQDSTHLDVIEIKGYGIGAGEVATALLWNAKVNNDPPPKDDSVVKDDNAVKPEKVSAVKSYDLIVDGAHADVKDMRNDSNTRLGGPISDDIVNSINANLFAKDALIALNMTVNDLVSQTSVMTAINKSGLDTDEALEKLEILIKCCNEAIKENIDSHYPAGIFVLRGNKITNYKGDNFVFSRYTEYRMSIALVKDGNAIGSFYSGIERQLEKIVNEKRKIDLV